MVIDEQDENNPDIGRGGAVNDVVCWFTNAYSVLIPPYVFNLWNKRRIKDVAKLKTAGLISSSAKVHIMAAYPGNSTCYGSEQGLPCAIHEVYLNGKYLGNLAGDTGWGKTTFQVPIEDLHFLSDTDNADSVLNTITVQYDAEWPSSGRAITCVAPIFWIAIQYTAAPPVVFVPGVGVNWGQWKNRLNNEGQIFGDGLDQPEALNLKANADELDEYLDEQRERWGVSKVALVTYSKGGVDAREYVRDPERAAKAASVVQVAAPNAGMSVFDWQLRWPIGQLAEVFWSNLNRIAEQAPVLLPRHYGSPHYRELTPASMEIFNRNWRPGSPVQFASCASIYTPPPVVEGTDVPYAIAWYFTSRHGPSDGLLTVESAHSLPGAFLHEAAGPPGNRSYWHRNTSDNLEIRNLGYAHSQPRQSAPRPTVMQSEIVDPQLIAARGDTVSGAVPHAVSFALSNEDSVFVHTAHSLGQWALSLVSPQGDTLRSDGSQTGNLSFSAGSDSLFGLPISGFIVESPPSGLWHHVASRTRLNEADSLGIYWFSVIRDSTLQAWTAEEPSAATTVGSNYLLRASLAPNVIGDSARARAYIELPDTTLATIPLNDLGANGDAEAFDGVYSAIWSVASMAGQYPITYEICTYTGGQCDYQATATAILDVGTGSSSVGANLTVSTDDLDSDGYIDSLKISDVVTVGVAGAYEYVIELEDARSIRFVQGVRRTLGTGWHPVTIAFDGFALFESGSYGPYVVREVRLYRVNDSGSVLEAEVSDALTTPSYGLFDFEHPPLLLTGSIEESSVDSDSDMLLDSLIVRLGCRSDSARVYSYFADLADTTGAIVSRTSGSIAVASDTSEVRMAFPGVCIAAAGRNGPYEIRDLSVLADPLFSEHFARVDTLNGAYTSEMFETAAGEMTISIPDTTLTMCPKGDSDHLLVEMTVPEICRLRAEQPRITGWLRIRDDSDPSLRIWGLLPNEFNSEGVLVEYAVGDTLPPTLWIDSTAVLRFDYERVSGCGALKLDIGYGLNVVQSSLEVSIRSYDFDPLFVGAVDQFDSLAVASAGECSDWNWNGIADDYADLAEHLSTRHSVPWRIIYPNGGEAFNRGDALCLSWAPARGDSAVVRVIARRWTGTSYADTVSLTSGMIDSGEMSWLIPPTLAMSDSYNIRVEHFAGSAGVTSQSCGTAQSELGWSVGEIDGGLGTNRLRMCPGGDGDTLRIPIDISCDQARFGTLQTAYAAIREDSDTTITFWQTLAGIPTSVDTLWATGIDPIQATAAIASSVASGCGTARFDIHINGMLAQTGYEVEVRSFDFDPQTVGAVDPGDSTGLGPALIAENPCVDFDFDGDWSSADQALFLDHQPHAGHHIPRKLTVPDADTTWYPQEMNGIHWIPGQGPNSTVSLYYYRDSDPTLHSIVDLTADDGHYTWQLPAGLSPGTDYRVKVVHRWVNWPDSWADLGRDVSDLPFEVGDPGCPYVQTWTDSQWKAENSILGRSLESSLAQDAYLIKSQPDRSGGRLKFRILENADEFTTLDRVSIAALDIAAGEKVLKVGNRYVAGTWEPATRVANPAGEEITHFVDGSRAEYYVGSPGDTLLVDLPPRRATIGADGQSAFSTTQGGGGSGGSGGGKGIDPAPEGPPDLTTAGAALDERYLTETGILVQFRNGNGDWETVQHWYPREHFDDFVVDGFTEGQMRLIFLGRHKLRYLGRFNYSQDGVTPKAARLLSANHTRLGDQLSAVQGTDESATIIAPGDTVTFEFETVAPEAGKTRHWFLVTNGVYSSAAPQAYLDEPSQTPAPTYAFALGAARPNPTSGNVQMDYSLARESNVSLRIYNVAGRLVRDLVGDRQKPGPYNLTWNLRDNGGVRVSSGVYFYRLVADEWTSQKKVVFIAR